MSSPDRSVAPPANGDEDAETSFPMALADRCVKCGLCLPHCPTYRLAGQEAESPRGRIALMQGLAGGRLKAEGALLEHLENCVGCRACEAVCPASVPYGRLLDAGRGLVPDRTPRLLDSLARHPGWNAASMTGLAGLRRVGLFTAPGDDTDSAWFERALRRLPLPPRAATLRQSYEPVGDPVGRVSLFSGCVTRVMDRRTLVNVAGLLARLGYRVDVPRDQVCCGALDQHAGRGDRARRLARDNCRAFGTEATPVLSTATGCTATLLDYGYLAPGEGEAFRTRVQDVTEFLLQAWEPGRRPPDTLPARVALHQPCTARHVTGSADATLDLLARIPGLEIRQLDASYGCCGAAGHHFLTRGRQADALVAPLLDQIAAIEPDFVVTTNIGCALHLGGSLGRRPQPPPVLHAVELLARALPEAG